MGRPWLPAVCRPVQGPFRHSPNSFLCFSPRALLSIPRKCQTLKYWLHFSMSFPGLICSGSPLCTTPTSNDWRLSLFRFLLKGNFLRKPFYEEHFSLDKLYWLVLKLHSNSNYLLVYLYLCVRGLGKVIIFFKSQHYKGARIMAFLLSHVDVVFTIVFITK